MIQPISVFGSLDQGIIDAINNVSMPQFASVWGVQGRLTFDRPAGAYALWLLDKEADQAGDLAYHIEVSGVPVAEVYLPTIARYNADLCQDIDHEIKEMLVDPTASLIVPRPGGGTIVKEVCDPVSNDGLDLGGGHTGANFVYPSWFIRGASGPYDASGLCTRPGETRPGGYVEAQVDGQWQLTAMRAENGLFSHRINRPGRLAYRAKNR